MDEAAVAAPPHAASARPAAATVRAELQRLFDCRIVCSFVDWFVREAGDWKLRAAIDFQ
jgi:hypothetical protein